MTKSFRHTYAFIALATSITPATAQEARETGEAASTTDEIIVQARRKGEDIQDVPLVVQAVSAETAQRFEIRQFEDVTKLVPGLQLTMNNNGLGTTASLRGVNFDANASGAATTVEFYRNDAVITSGALFQAIYDIGQIEVLRGPQGTLRGRASPSGSITVTTRRPDLDRVEGYVSGTLTDQSRWNFNGAINVPVVANALAVRVAGFAGENRGNDVTGYNLRTGIRDDDVYDKTNALRVSVQADPLDGILVLDFNYETIRHRNRQYNQVESFRLIDATAGTSPLLVTAGDRLGITATPRSFDQRYKIFNWQAQLNLWGQQLTYVGSKVDALLNAVEVQDNAGLYESAIPVATPDAPFTQDTVTLNKQTTHELRLQSQERIANIFDYVVGAMQVKSNTPSFLSSITAVGSPTTLYSVSYLGLNRYRADEEQSLFGNVTAHLTDRLELSGGIRRIWFKSNSGVKTGAFGADPSTYVESPANRRCNGHQDIPGCLPTKKATIYNAVAKYDVSDNIMAYASYGTSWRPGNSIIGFRGEEVGLFLNQFLNLPDERSRSYEIGIKTSWLNDRITFNISAYSQKFSNYAFRVASPVLALSSPNLPATLATPFNFVTPVPAKVKGLEADLAFAVSQNFNVGATVAFADGKISNGTFPCLDLNDDNVPDTGAPPTAQQLYDHVGANQVDTCVGNTSSSTSPRWSGTVQAEYTHSLSPLADGFLRGFVSWKGHNEGFGLNPYDQVKPFGLLDLFAGVRDPDGAWELTLFARNVLNTKRVLTRGDSPQITPLRAGVNLSPLGGTGTSINSSSATNYLGITTLAPREVGATVKFAFGS